MMHPQDILKDDSNEIVTDTGIRVRKGTIFATILNASRYDDLIRQNDSEEKENCIHEVMAAIKNVIPGLNSLNLFDFFSPHEWLVNMKAHEGRSLVALLYLQAFRSPKLIQS